MNPSPKSKVKSLIQAFQALQALNTAFDLVSDIHVYEAIITGVKYDTHNL